ncbi:MAG: peptidoglycan bridge formation glycyltransferase FemA/FemB family protein [Patescibacteria group bacterium]|nr:peptidoglycan bridge formation glycyltransferase FemA/FemB family protein [Patescibacteria group bacterium]
MQIVHATDELKDHWDNFVKNTSPDGGLLQSWGWGDFQKSLDNKIYRLAALDGLGQLQAVTLLIKHDLHFEYNYLYCPRGPLVNTLKVDDLTALFNEIRKVAKDEKSFSLRVDPPWLIGNEARLTDYGFRKAENEVQPKCSLVLDISKSEAEILASMKQKTRYNIGLAQRHGVKVKVSSEISDIETFWQLIKQTSGRDGFKPHAKEHYKKMLEAFAKTGTIKLFMAEYQNKIIAVNMVSYFGNVATYLHGSSSDIYREVMSPYLLQWQAIIEAKKVGCQLYDFGGVNGRSFHNKMWQGITRFKLGFADEASVREYIGSYDLVINPVIFSVYKFVKQIRG